MGAHKRTDSPATPLDAWMRERSMTNAAFAQRVADVMEVEQVYPSTISRWRTGKQKLSATHRLIIQEATRGKIRFNRWGSWTPSGTRSGKVVMRYEPPRKTRGRA